MPKVRPITVFDQNLDGHLAPDGESETCGVHALVNALVYLQNSNSKKQNQILNDPDFFEDAYQQAKQFFPQQMGGHDITLATQRKLLSEIHRKAWLENASQALKALEKSQNNLPSISTGEIYGDQNFNTIGSVDNLYDLATLYEISKFPKNKPFQHAFVVGLNGVHWITLVLKQNNKGERSWFGMDSYGNQKKYFGTASANLEEMIDPNYLKNNMTRIYKECTIVIEHLYNHSFKGKENLNEEGRKFLLDKKSLEERMQYLKNAANFMRRIDWLKNPSEHQTEIQQLARLVNFYVENKLADQELVAINESLSETLEMDKQRGMLLQYQETQKKIYLDINETFDDILLYIVETHPNDLRKEEIMRKLKTGLDEKTLKENANEIGKATDTLLTFLQDKKARSQDGWFAKAAHAIWDFFKAVFGKSDLSSVKQRLGKLIKPIESRPKPGG